MGDLELSGCPRLSGPGGRWRPGQARGYVLVRLHAEPLGVLSVALGPAGPSVSGLAARARVELAAEIRRHLEADGQLASEMGQGLPGCTGCSRPPSAAPVRPISVVVCTRDRPGQLRQALAGLRELDYSAFEIVVVDNAPHDSTVREVVDAAAAQDGRVRYTCEPRPGLANARNHGLVVAKFDTVAFTDDDARVDPGWLAWLARAFDRDPHSACVTGLVAPAELDSLAQRYFERRVAWGEKLERRRFDLATNRPASATFPYSSWVVGTGANFAVRREVVLALGGFDPLLGPGAPARGGDDIDLFLRLLLAGHTISYEPAAVVWHTHRSETCDLVRQMYDYGVAMGSYAVTHARDFRAESDWAARAPGVAESFLAASAGKVLPDVLAAPRAQLFVLAEMAGLVTGLIRFPRIRRRESSPGGSR